MLFYRQDLLFLAWQLRARVADKKYCSCIPPNITYNVLIFSSNLSINSLNKQSIKNKNSISQFIKIYKLK